MAGIGRRAYAEMFGPTVGDRLRLADTDLTERDAGVRYNLFSPSIDPVWGRVDAMIGPEGSELIRSNLQLL